MTYKVLLLGDTTVGKTCYLMRFTENTFQETHMATIGLDYRIKDMELKSGKIIKLQIWDTAGQERFRTITKNYYKGAHGILIIYDVTKLKTFENVRNWVDQIKESASEDSVIYLLGNKVDDEDNRKVSTEEGNNLAKEFNLKFFETSAKNDINVKSTFEEMVEDIDKKVSPTMNEGTGKKLDKNGGENNKKKKCC